MEIELAKLWTPGVQDGVVSAVVFAILAFIAVWLRKTLVIALKSVWRYFNGQVVVSRWALLSLVGFAFGIASISDKGMTPALVLASLSALSCVALIVWGTHEWPPGEAAEGQPIGAPRPAFTPSDLGIQIILEFLREPRSEQRLTAGTFSKRFGQSEHVMLHQLEVLFEAGWLLDTLPNGLSGRSFYLSPLGRAMGLPLQPKG